LRLLPKHQRSAEGKRHITTVPVRLIRATNDVHREHVDTKFCRASIGYLEQVASVLGPQEVLFISQDDKVRNFENYFTFPISFDLPVNVYCMFYRHAFRWESQLQINSRHF